MTKKNASIQTVMSKNSIAGAAATVLLACAAQSAFGQSWQGPSGLATSPISGNWNLASNWSTNALPAPTGNVSFGGSGSGAYTLTNDVASQVLVALLGFASNSTAVPVISGNAIQANQISMQNSGSFRIEAPLVLGVTNTQINYDTNATGNLIIAGGLSGGPSNRNLVFNASNASNSVVALTGGASTGSGSITLGTATTGAFSISNPNQLFAGNLNINGGVLVLDSLSWTDFTVARTAGSGAGQFQFQGNSSGFAARGTALVINDSQTTATTFDRNFRLGSVAKVNGQFWANAGVEIARGTTLASGGVDAERVITLAHTGPGRDGTTGAVHKISGNITDHRTANSGIGNRGALRVTGATTSNFAEVGELVLSGQNTWTGSATSGAFSSQHFNTGPGGLMVQSGIVRFDGDASLPIGNGGSPSFLAAINSNSSQNFSSKFGYLLTGSAAGKTYDLPTGSRFVLGGVGSNENTAILGSSDGNVVLRNSSVALNTGAATGSLATVLLTRAGSTFTLGTTGIGPEGAVTFQATSGFDNADSGRAGNATAIGDSSDTTGTQGKRFLEKRGPGTAVLENVQYQFPSNNADASNRFTYRIFEGGIRQTGTAFNNSLSGNSNLRVQLLGGVIEVAHSATFGMPVARADIFVGPGNLDFSNGTTGNLAGGGFAGYSVNLNDVRTVTLSTANLTWASTGGFLSNGAPLIFGSATANTTLNFTNSLNLNAVVREVRVNDNLNSATDVGRLSGVLSNGGLTKTGTGVLELTNTNTYALATTVSGGALVIASTGTINSTIGITLNGGTLRYNSATTLNKPVTFGASGGKLGGTGSIGVAISADTGDTIAPGNSVGSQTYSAGLTVGSGGVYEWELIGNAASGAGAVFDQIVVSGGNLEVNSAAVLALRFASAGSTVSFTDAFWGTDRKWILIDYTAAGASNGLFTSGLFTSDVNYGAFGAFATANVNGDVVLQWTPIPEPTSVLGLAGLFAGCALRRRVRN